MAERKKGVSKRKKKKKKKSKDFRLFVHQKNLRTNFRLKFSL